MEHDERFHRLAPQGVGHADDRRFLDGLVAEEDLLDLAREHLESGHVGDLQVLRDVHGMRSTFPVVFRPSSARCASDASFSGNSNSVRNLSLPSRIQPSSSPDRWRSSARVMMWWLKLGRVRKSEPLALSVCGSKAPMGPLD